MLVEPSVDDTPVVHSRIPYTLGINKPSRETLPKPRDVGAIESEELLSVKEPERETAENGSQSTLRKSRQRSCPSHGDTGRPARCIAPDIEWVAPGQPCEHRAAPNGYPS